MLLNLQPRRWMPDGRTGFSGSRRCLSEKQKHQRSAADDTKPCKASKLQQASYNIGEEKANARPRNRFLIARLPGNSAASPGSPGPNGDDGNRVPPPPNYQEGGFRRLLMVPAAPSDEHHPQSRKRRSAHRPAKRCSPPKRASSHPLEGIFTEAAMFLPCDVSSVAVHRHHKLTWAVNSS